MSPSALLGDRAPSCMLYSMVECRAWGSRTHPWPCRAMPGNSVQRRCAPRREGKGCHKRQWPLCWCLKKQYMHRHCSVDSQCTMFGGILKYQCAARKRAMPTRQSPDGLIAFVDHRHTLSGAMNSGSCGTSVSTASNQGVKRSSSGLKSDVASSTPSPWIMPQADGIHLPPPPPLLPPMGGSGVCVVMKQIVYRYQPSQNTVLWTQEQSQYIVTVH